MSLRLWHQSSSSIGGSSSYQELILRHAKRILPDAQIDLHGVNYPKGDGFRGVRSNAYAQMLTDVQCAHNIVQAEDEGYDAFVYTCFNDPGLIEGRSMVDMPVVGLCETSILAGLVVGRSIGIIGANPNQAHLVEKTLHKERLEDRVVCVLPMTKPLSGGFSGDGPDGGQSVVDSFIDAARRAIAAGADVLISGEGPVNILLADHGVFEVDGVRVIDSWAAVLQRAAAMDALRKTTGVSAIPSRANLYHGISHEVAAALARSTAEVLVSGWQDHRAPALAAR